MVESDGGSVIGVVEPEVECKSDGGGAYKSEYLGNCSVQVC